MLILANTNREMSFEVSRVNGRVFLAGSLEGIEYKGSEWNSPCNYYVVESSEGIFELNKAMEAKVIVFETIYETGLLHEKTSFEKLASTFGNRKFAEHYKRKGIEGYSKRFFTSKFQYREQVLPPIDKEKWNPEERFPLEKMFPQDVLSSFLEIKLDTVLLHPDLMSLKQDVNYKIHFLLADCIIKLMEKKYVTSDCLNDSGYSSFFEMIKDEVENRMLTPLCRDKLAILCYILFLQIEGSSVRYEVLPDFKFSKEKVLAMFRVIGCSYIAKLDSFKMKEKQMHPSDTRN
ncbi:uncharacterized protein Eint_041020 [Encephalitozoon intestinalis ATCC 50506]|uniref:Uncharacterized protein n=1 Tax=Encephalitozoon intestinalis (strain ATCC 50506) TaxID=876142 RepID=E0S6Q6_ENCIT|nr:uncharacterized protein Eint_041020 [Encephalitozoon intestinalis ATCC 50506]ADM11391.1 hypothetical protein Eint_041020 [Encephalitozoon intestinalis ATCC 50506]UTX45082.1 hypothetical protein GPK93_04g06200 [Encephalitozoon intestinalis]